MLNLWWTLLVLLIISSKPISTKYELSGFYNTAEITGIDKSMRPCNGADPCSCPGGFFFHIDETAGLQQASISRNSFKALQLPNGFDLGDTPTFPIKVTIAWKYDAVSCDSSRIVITSIKKR